MNDSVKSVIALVVICLTVTLALSAVNYVTAPIIEENNAKAVQGSFAEALPGADGFEELEPAADAPETVKSIYKENNGLGYVVVLETTSQYSESPMGISVGIGTDGIIKNIVLTNYAETKNFGADYPASYIGQDSALAGVELVSGVTYSSTAFRNAVTDAYTALFAVADVAAGEMSDDQMAADAIGELLPASLDNTGACQVEESDGLFVSSNRTGYAMVADKVAYVTDAFGNYIGSKSFDDAASEDASVVEAVKASAAEAYAAASEKNIKRIVKMYEDAEVTTLVPTGVQSSVNGAYSFTSEGTAYYAMTTSTFGYGGPVNIMYIVDENGTIAKFKVLSHNETEYYGDVVSQSAYTGGYPGQVLGSISDDVLIQVFQCCLSMRHFRKEVRYVRIKAESLNKRLSSIQCLSQTFKHFLFHCPNLGILNQLQTLHHLFRIDRSDNFQRSPCFPRQCVKVFCPHFFGFVLNPLEHIRCLRDSFLLCVSITYSTLQFMKEGSQSCYQLG